MYPHYSCADSLALGDAFAEAAFFQLALTRKTRCDGVEQTVTDVGRGGEWNV